MARVSIVIPTYNRARYLPKAISSALEQPFRDLEVIVVDDGSTDETREIVDGFADRRLTYVYQGNQGATAAFNVGLETATGEYVSILGSDDWYVPSGLQRLHDVLESSPEVGLAAGGYTFVDEGGNTIRHERAWIGSPTLDVKTWLCGCPVLLQAALIRRRWIERIGGFDRSIPSIQDWDFGLRLAHAGCLMSWVEELVFCYRIHGNQLTSDTTNIAPQLLRVLDNFFANPNLSGDLRSSRNYAYAVAYLSRAVLAYWSGRIPDAKDDLARAAELSPRVLENRGQQIFDRIVGWAGHPVMADPIGYIESSFNNLPAEAQVVQGRRREAIARAAIERFFHAYAVRDWPTVRRMHWVMASTDFSWIRNRGVWSILMQMLVATRIEGHATHAS